MECGPACHDICGYKLCKSFTTNECFEQCACPEGLVENEDGQCVEMDCKYNFSLTTISEIALLNISARREINNSVVGE